MCSQTNRGLFYLSGGIKIQEHEIEAYKSYIKAMSNNQLFTEIRIVFYQENAILIELCRKESASRAIETEFIFIQEQVKQEKLALLSMKKT